MAHTMSENSHYTIIFKIPFNCSYFYYGLIATKLNFNKLITFRDLSEQNTKKQKLFSKTKVYILCSQYIQLPHEGLQ